MSGSREIAIEPRSTPVRLDRALADAWPDLSRTTLARLIDAGLVTVDGRPAAPSRKVAGGELVRCEVPEPEDATVEAEDIPLRIVHEDDALIVVDKPSGLVVHPGAGVRRGTLVNALLHHCGGSLLGIGGERRPGIVHRLDRGTSGLIVAAKTELAHARLSAQFAKRTVGKTYLALVRGAPAGTGSVDAPIGRSTTKRTRMATGVARGRASLTTWTRRESFGTSAALLEVALHTGRTHQVRVHLAHAGHPLVGDATYGSGGVRAPDAALRPHLTAFPRPALHAWRLAFDHPATGERVAFEAEMPGDLSELLATLRALAPRSRAR